jgi:hypothetical protein
MLVTLDVPSNIRDPCVFLRLVEPATLKLTREECVTKWFDLQDRVVHIIGEETGNDETKASGLH